VQLSRVLQVPQTAHYMHNVKGCPIPTCLVQTRNAQRRCRQFWGDAA